MPWVATDDFESYTTATTLNGNAGGSGWAAAWSDNGIGDWTVEAAPGGGKAARCNSNLNNTHAYRTVSGVTAGTIQWRMRINVNNPFDFAGVVLEDGASPGNNGRCYVAFAGDGTIKAYDNDFPGLYQTLASYSVDTWYTITLEFDALTNLYRVKVDSGAYSEWLIPNTGGMADITLIRLDSSSAAGPSVTLWIDDIGPEVAAAAVTYFRSNNTTFS